MTALLDSILAAFLGNHAAFRFAVDGLADELRVVRFSLSEGLSQLYELHLELACHHGGLALEQVRHRPAALSLASPAGPRHVHGMLRRFAYAETRRRFTIYRAVLVPRLWLLGQRRGCRIFQHQTTQEIVTAVLRDAGIAGDELRFTLGSDYAPHDYCTQYRETDLDFLRRLLEQDGMSFFFEHAEDRHTLVIGDDAGAHPPIPGSQHAPSLPFQPPGGTRTVRERVSALDLAEAIKPGKATLRDFDFTRPGLDMQVELPANLDPELEIYDYPGGYQDPGTGLVGSGVSLGQRRLEGLQSGLRVIHGDSDCVRLSAGHVVHITGHDQPGLQGDFLLTQISHHGAQPQALDDEAEGTLEYACHFTAQPVDDPCRPERCTPRPLLAGLQTATVVGPAGDEIYPDEFGRVKVQFHWDRQGLRDEHSSCWLRVAQPWAGPGFGVQMIPRVGHEVVVAFLEGDPDRPLILGSVYNGDNALPHPTPAEKTRTAIRTRSTPGGDGFNELRFEDEKGAEQLLVRAERDLDLHVGNVCRQHVSADHHASVGTAGKDGKVGDLLEEVLRDHHRKVHRDSRIHLGGNLDLSVGGIDGAGNTTASIAGQLVAELQAACDLMLKNALTLRIAGASELGLTGLKLHSTGTLQLKSTGAAQFVSGAPLVLEATGGLTLKVGASSITLSDGDIAITGGKILLNSGGSPLHAQPHDPPPEHEPWAIGLPIAPDPADDGT